MSEFKFSCPHCDQHIQCDSKFSGRQIQCPGCNHLIVIPPSPAVAEKGNYQAQLGMTWATHVPPPPGRASKRVFSEEGRTAGFILKPLKRGVRVDAEAVKYAVGSAPHL